LSTTVVQPESTSEWRREVSLRLAAHKSRRAPQSAQPAEPATPWAASSARAAAAARVAARYANAPSYSQALASEAAAAAARAELPPAVVPAPVEVQPEAVAEPVAAVSPSVPQPAHLPLDAAAPPTRDREPVLHPAIAAVPSSLEAWESDCAHNHWQADLAPARPAVLAPAALCTPIPGDDYVAPVIEQAPDPEREKWVWPEAVANFSEGRENEFVEPDQPIPANLIEFPRELVAARKMRPRRAEGPFATSRPEPQLNIFEVDPRSISTRPEASGATALATWPEPSWAEIELEPQLRDEAGQEETPAELSEFQLAPIGRRIAAALADSVLIAIAVLVPAFMAASKSSFSHPTRLMEVSALLVFLAAGLLYHGLFLMLAGFTPGMKYAEIALSNFDGHEPTRRQLRSRLGALMLSLVPVGLGIAWALFDEDHLSWHDRLSKTYLREI